MSANVCDRRSSRRIRLPESLSEGVLTLSGQSLDVCVVDYSSGGFLVEMDDPGEVIADQGLLSIWGQQVIVQKRHERCVEAKRQIGWQREESAFPQGSMDQRHAEPQLQYFRSRPGRGSTMAIGLAVGGLVALAVGCLAHLLVTQAHSDRQEKTTGFYERLAQTTHSPLPGQNSSSGGSRIVASAPSTSSATRAEFSSHRRECSLDLRHATSRQAGTAIQNSLEQYNASSYRMLLEVPVPGESGFSVELQCTSGTIRRLLHHFSSQKGWAQFRQVVAGFVTQRLSADQARSEPELKWNDLRLRWGGYRTIVVETANSIQSKKL